MSTGNQIEPPVDAFKLILEMKFTLKHEQAKILDSSVSELLLGCQVSAYASQKPWEEIFYQP